MFYSVEAIYRYMHSMHSFMSLFEIRWSCRSTRREREFGGNGAAHSKAMSGYLGRQEPEAPLSPEPATMTFFRREKADDIMTHFPEADPKELSPVKNPVCHRDDLITEDGNYGGTGGGRRGWRP